ncbi:hypothetical protein BJX76DRAFT_342280 [Aspergillus varians]
MASRFTEKMGPAPTWRQEGPPPPAYGYHQQPYQQPYQQQHPQYPPQYPPQQPPQYAQSYPQPYPQPYPQQSQPGYSQAPPQGPPPPLQSFPRGLEVAFTSWSGRHMRVTENTYDGPLVYAADLHNRKPHMLFQAKGTANLPATVIFHTFSRTVDITINGNDFPMRSESKWKHEYGFDAAALGGKRLVWKNTKKWVTMNLECVDASGTVYARFTAHKGWSGKKTGRLEILEPAAAGGKVGTDELVVTGLANVYMQIVQAAGSAGAAGASSSVAVSV